MFELRIAINRPCQNSCSKLVEAMVVSFFQHLYAAMDLGIKWPETQCYEGSFACPRFTSQATTVKVWCMRQNPEYSFCACKILVLCLCSAP